MDLSQFAALQPADGSAQMELRDVSGQPVLKADGTPITITLLGKDSDAWTKHENAMGDSRLNQRGQHRLKMERLKAENVAGYAKCTVSWDGIGLGEETTACTYENALKLYTAFPAIRDQVDEFMGERANFLKVSPSI